MNDSMIILVGTVGQGIVRSDDGGEDWRMVGIRGGLHSDAMVRCITNRPDRPATVFSGTDKGLYKSEDSGRSWEFIDSPLNDYCVWAIAVDSKNPDVMFAGTGTPDPVVIFRSRDGGATWERRPVEVAAECVAVGVPRVTCIAIDPDDSNDVWIGLEVDGVRRSLDGGDTWQTLEDDIPNLDVHNIAITPGPPKSVVVVVNDGVYTSNDGGNEWNVVSAKETFPLKYPRGIAVLPGAPDTLLLAIGDSTPGRTGAVLRSNDSGATWKPAELSVPPNTAMWVVEAQPFASGVAFAGSRYGYLYRSDDSGASWSKLWREFSEISSLLLIPDRPSI